MNQHEEDPADKWTAVTEACPCPVCDGPDNCTVAQDGRAVYCGRIEEGSVRQNEGGQWLHYLDHPIPRCHNPHNSAEHDPSGNGNTSVNRWDRLAEKYVKAANRRSRSLGKLAKELGVTVASLKAIGIGWDDDYWTSPERDAAGHIIGIVKRGADGNKKSMKGGKRGLSYDPKATEDSGPIILVEGATDTAAARTLGFAAIGRPSNNGGIDHLAELLKDVPSEREIIVLGENDEKPNGTWPGRDGAIRTATKLSKILGRKVHYALTPDNAKDIRVWLQEHGNDRESFLSRLSLNEVTPPKADTLQWQPFPTEKLSAILFRYIDKSSRAIGCDPSFVAVPLLAALASAIRNARKIQLRRGWTEPSVLWAVCIGESGCLKSPAHDAAMYFIRKKQDELFQKYKQEVRDWNSLSKEEKSTTPYPIPERVKVSDITVEALAVRLDENPDGLLSDLDELSGLFKGFNQYKGKGNDESHYLAMHGARPLTVDRKTGDKKTLHIKNANLSIAGGIQPGVLKKELTQDRHDSGMTARMLMTMPPRRKKTWTDEELTPEDRRELSTVFQKLYELRDTVTGKTTSDGTPLELSEDAKRLFKEFYERHAEEESSLSGVLAAAWSKLEGTAARLALIFHLVRWASGEAVSDEVVDVQSMESAIHIVEWFKHETRRVYAALKESPEENQQRQLIELIQRKGGTVTPREVTRSSRQFGGNEEAEKQLQRLAHAGFGKWEVIKSGGRPRSQFSLSVAVAKSV
ncbi:MAG: DUF3987 domain-containing protein [Planctomycetaceae bacterium]|jgi:hypothetical protein|nr:DUF3987 domain-containing protein [Planctomycetaceae bacterium]